MRRCFLLYFLCTGGKLHFYSLGTVVLRKLQVSRGMQSLWLWVSNRGEQHPVGTRFCSAKSSVLYLLRPLTLERGCHRTEQTISYGSRRANICEHGRLADIRSSGVGDAAKRRSMTEATLHHRGSKRYIKPAAATYSLFAVDQFFNRKQRFYDGRQKKSSPLLVPPRQLQPHIIQGKCLRLFRSAFG